MEERQPIFYTTHNLAVDAVYVVHPKVLEECMPNRVGVPFLFYVGLGGGRNSDINNPAHTISQQFMGLSLRRKDGTPYINPEAFERDAARLGIVRKEGEYFPLIYPFVGNRRDLSQLLKENELKEGEKWVEKPAEITVGDKTYPYNRVANAWVPFSAGVGYEGSCIDYFLSEGTSIQSRESFAKLKEYLRENKEELTRPLTRKEQKQLAAASSGVQKKRGLLARLFG